MTSNSQSSLVFYERPYLDRYSEADRVVRSGLCGSGFQHWNQIGKTKGYQAFWVNPHEIDAGQYLLHYPDVEEMIESGQDWEVKSAGDFFIKYGNSRRHVFFRKSVEHEILHSSGSSGFPAYPYGRVYKSSPGEQGLVSPVLPTSFPDTNTVQCDVVVPYTVSCLQWVILSVDSILNQNRAECVVHLVNDGFDSSLDRFVREYYRGVSPVRLYRNDRSYGPYVSVNRLFDYLETDYLAIQDSDDIATPNRISRSVRVLMETGYEIFNCVSECFVDFHSITSGRRNLEQKYLLDQLQEKVLKEPYHVPGMKWDIAPLGATVNSTTTICKDYFEKINGFMDCISSGDCEFSTRAQASGGRVYASDQIGCLKRGHIESVSHGKVYHVGSEETQKVNDKLLRLYEIYLSDPNFDPAEYGSLNRYRDAEGLLKIQ